MVFNNLVKYILNDGGIIKDIYIDGKDSNGTGLCNASVLFINDELHMILRNVEYTLHHSEGQQKYQTRYEGPLSYYHRDDYLRLKTTNFYCKLDVDNLDIINYSEIDTTKLHVEPVWTFIGLEDVRLVYWDNKYYACGVRRDTKTNGEGRMELSELEINENSATPSVLNVKEVNRNRIQVENINSYCEKNWMPIKNKPFHFIKWSNPTEVVTVDLKTNSSKSIFRSDKTHDLPLDLRGGSQLIPWENNTYLAIVHECKFTPKNHNGYKDSAYYHRFVIWNDDFTINHISERFNFMTASVEFCIGLEEVNNNIVIIFGFQDNGCYALKINKQKFKNILFNTLKNGAHAPCSTHISQQQKSSLLVNVVNDPYNDLFNYNLAYFYEMRNQYAIAYSFYLRCAEFTDDKVLSSEALIRCSLCISKQKNRCQKELYLIKHAMTASPNSIEPYYIASLYFSWRSGNAPEKRFWLDSYMYACMGINILENNLQTTSFKNDIGYNKVNIYYQKAFAGSNIGKLDEAREIYTQMLTTFEISDEIRKLIVIKKQQLPEPSHPIATYTNNKLDCFKFYFKNCHKIEYNYSQIYQDMFTLSMHNGKNYGTYLEIGAGDYKYGNNTYLLEKEFDWSGISIDFNKAHVETFNNIRKKCLCKDATKIDYIKLLNQNYESTNIDYLQLDCDPPNITFDILTKIPFNNYKFGVITYEHGYYNDNTGNYREKSRNFLKEKGYKLIAGNISSYKDKCPFEDWWVHPELVDENIYKLFERNDDIPINGEKYMLTKSKYIQEPISEISNIIINDDPENNHKTCDITIPQGHNNLSWWGCGHKNDMNSWNWGDQLNPWLFSKIKGIPIEKINRVPLWSEESIPRYYMIGSILSFIYDQKVEVWGSGLGGPSPPLKFLPKKIHAVRGPLTRNALIKLGCDCPEVYGDPALLLPRYYTSNVKKEYKYGIIQHFSRKEDTAWVAKYRNDSNINIIDIKHPSIIGFIDEINKCDIILSESLHGIICGDAYGIPSYHINFNTNKEYNWFKFNDYLLSVGRPLVTPLLLIDETIDIYNLRGSLYNYSINIDLDKLLQSCPYNNYNEYPEISNKQDKIIITFGTDDLFKNKKIRFKQQATDINFFDSVIIEDEKTIKPLLKEHEEFIINNKRGYGYWIWKAFIIKNQLEKMKTNDILFYLDCGSSIINNNVERLDNYINILKDYDVMVFDNPDHKTKKNVKMNVINEFNIEDDILEQNLIEGGCIILKNTKKTKEFIDEWKRYMIKDNYQLVNDDLLNLPQHEEFMEHRHDQSILTILARQKDYVYVNNGLQELYNKGPLFHSRLTDIGPRKYAKPIPQYTYNNCSSMDIKYGVNKHTYKTPNLIVIDNFYENPDKIREYALSLNYQPPENHGAVGYRCESGRKIQEGTKELFEKLLHATIPGGNKKGSWDYSTNGCFQWCNAKTSIVYHSDEQQYAAIVYLTPNAPPNTGTSFFRHKKYKLRNNEVFSKSDWYQSDLNYKEPHLDKTQWETVDSIGNVYNRLVIFNAHYIHGVTEYFGEDINNSRLFQLFFFNKD